MGRKGVKIFVETRYIPITCRDAIYGVSTNLEFLRISLISPLPNAREIKGKAGARMKKT